MGDQKRPAGAASGACRVNPNLRLAFRASDAAPLLQPDRAVCVRLQQGQAAYFRVPDAAGGFYVVTTRRLSGDTDTVLAVLDRAGRPIATDDDGGEESLASRLEFAQDTGAAMIRASTLEDQGGSFEIVLTRMAAPPPADFPTSLSRAGEETLQPGQNRHIVVGRRQTAFFALPDARENLSAVTLNLRGDTDTVLAVVNAEGRVLAEDDDGGEGFASELPLSGLPEGPLFLRVGTLESAPGEFDLVLRQDAPRTPPDFPTTLQSAREQGPLAPDASRHLTLRRRESALFALPDGQDVIALTRNLQGETDTVLALLDADGRLLAEDDDGGGGFASRLSTRGQGRRAAFLRVQTLNGQGGAFDLVLRPLGGASLGAPVALAGNIEAARQQPLPPLGEAIAITLEPGQSAVFNLPYDGKPLIALTFGLAPGSDSVLELLDAEGNVIDANDDMPSGLSSQLEIGAEPRPAFLRARQADGRAAAFQLVLIRPGR